MISVITVVRLRPLMVVFLTTAALRTEFGLKYDGMRISSLYRAIAANSELYSGYGATLSDPHSTIQTVERAMFDPLCNQIVYQCNHADNKCTYTNTAGNKDRKLDLIPFDHVIIFGIEIIH